MKNLSALKRGVVFIAVMAVLCVGFAAVSKTLNVNQEVTAADTMYQTDDPDAPDVYMTTEITPEALVKIYDRLGFEPEGNVAVKMSTGEPPNSNYLRPELIGDLVQKVDGTIVECNTAYGGSRASTAAHKQVIEDHGLNAISKNGVADIMDEDGSMTIPVPAPANGTSTITEDYVGAHLENYDSLICLSHFKGHSMAGYGGAINNMSIGIGSSEGKAWIHSGGTSHTSPWGGNQERFLESMGDATSAVVDYMDGKVVYINVMNRLSVDCDCDGNPAEPDMHDIGILASYDPVALDQACLDLIAQAQGNTSFLNRVNRQNGYHTLEHAAEIGLGSREYNLIDIESEPSPTPTVTPSPEPQANMTYTDGALTISNLEGSAKLIHASYKGGILTNVEITDAANGTTNIPTRSGDKFMLWNTLGEIMPLSKAITVEMGTYNEDNKSKILIVYFSRAGENWEVGYVDKGNTAVIADYINENEKIDADVFEITPVDPYPESYDETLTRVQSERDNNARPEFNGEIENFDQYDTVFLGYPIWYGGLPMIMYTFLEEYDMSGKTVIPFSTHGGSGWGSTKSELNTLCPGAEFVDGFSTAGTNARSAQDAVNSWLEGLNF